MRILVFSPFAGIRPHAILENQLSEILEVLGHEVLQVTCDSIFKSYCPVFQNHGVSSEDSIGKIETCKICKSSAQFRNSSKLDVGEFLSESDFKRADEYIQEISEICRLQNGKFDFNLVINRDFVRSSIYESLLKFKKRDLIMEANEAHQIFSTIKSSHLADSSSLKIIKEINPEIVMIFTPQYGINSAVANNARKNESTVYYMAGNNSLVEMHKTLKIYNWNQYHLKDPGLDFWDINEVKLSRSDIQRCRYHFKAIANNHSVFTYSPKSKNRSIRDFFKIKQQDKLILLALSSYDEFFAAGTCGYFPESVIASPVFEDQNAWVEATVLWASNQKNLTLIIRPHPREFPNRRDSRSAPLNVRLKEILDKLPENVLVDLPEYQLSMQEYYKEVNAILVSWSSVSLEALERDIPVISYDEKLVMIPREIHLTGESKAQYLSNLNRVMSGATPTEFRLNAYKWFAHSNFKGSIYLGGGFLASKLVKTIPKLSGIYFMLERQNPSLIYFIDSKFHGSRRDKPMLKKLLENKLGSFYDIQN
ncbi:hypothetical protein MCEMRE22_00040 [Candidatus Nanopelagicaceae bacterium]